MSFTLLSATATLLTVLGALLWWKKIPPNRYLGFRTPSTLRDPTLWYAVNVRAGIDLVALGTLLQLLTLGARVEHVAERSLLVVYLLALHLGFFVLLLRGVRAVSERRIAQACQTRMRSRA